MVYHQVKFVDKFNDFTNVALVESGKAIDQPEDPYFRGYQFAGWFTDEAASEKYDFSNPASGDITLYAGYKKVEYEGEKTDEADKTADKPTTEQPAPQKESAISQTGDNALMLVVGAVSAVALVVALGATMMRRRNQRQLSPIDALREAAKVPPLVLFGGEEARIVQNKYMISLCRLL